MKAIKAIYNGIDKFNDACRASVLKYTNEWQNYVHRQARWVDFEHAVFSTGRRSGLRT